MPEGVRKAPKSSRGRRGEGGQLPTHGKRRINCSKPCQNRLETRSARLNSKIDELNNKILEQEELINEYSAENVGWYNDKGDGADYEEEEEEEEPEDDEEEEHDEHDAPPLRMTSAAAARPKIR